MYNPARKGDTALEPIEDDPHLAALADLLAAQARDLHRVFARAFADMLLGKTRSFRDVGRALKAQHQCRIALRLLVALRAAGQTTKKSPNRTNRLLREENRHHDQDLGQAPSESPSCPDQAAHRGEVAGAPRPQAELVRSTKPWLKSTGPRTEEGKARSAHLRVGTMSVSVAIGPRSNRGNLGARVALMTEESRTIRARDRNSWRQRNRTSSSSWETTSAGTT